MGNEIFLNIQAIAILSSSLEQSRLTVNDYNNIENKELELNVKDHCGGWLLSYRFKRSSNRFDTGQLTYLSLVSALDPRSSNAAFFGLGLQSVAENHETTLFRFTLQNTVSLTGSTRGCVKMALRCYARHYMLGKALHNKPKDFTVSSSIVVIRNISSQRPKAQQHWLPKGGLLSAQLACPWVNIILSSINNMRNIWDSRTCPYWLISS